jgi:hypothetical protein
MPAPAPSSQAAAPLRKALVVLDDRTKSPFGTKGDSHCEGIKPKPGPLFHAENGVGLTLRHPVLVGRMSAPDPTIVRLVRHSLLGPSSGKGVRGRPRPAATRPSASLMARHSHPQRSCPVRPWPEGQHSAPNGSAAAGPPLDTHRGNRFRSHWTTDWGLRGDKIARRDSVGVAIQHVPAWQLPPSPPDRIAPGSAL